MNIWRIVYRGSAYILLDRWSNANDHMYIENLAINKNPCPPFCQYLGGCTPFCHPPLERKSDGSCDIWDLECHQCGQTLESFGKKYEVAQVTAQLQAQDK